MPNFDTWDVAEYYNAFEVFLWAAFAIGIGLKARKTSEPVLKRRLIILTLVFVIFSMSDMIEIQTGAWWRPWWLFVIKAACVTYFIFAGVIWIREQKRSLMKRRP